MPVPQRIRDLVQLFDDNHQAYKNPVFKEAQARKELIDPFFEELGWDLSNLQGFAQQYKDVVHEDALKIGGKNNAPDYSFRIGGVRKFFLEAKKPSVNIKEEIDPAFQLRRYAWSAKLPLSILTDFEEFSVYDTRIKPKKTDKAGVGRILYMRYDEYEARWDEIASVFSKAAILKGGFDKWADDRSTKKGTQEVDDAILSEIESWREALAKNIYLRNNHLCQPELNEAVQKTIDRIIFLRICEDRGIEPYQRLGKIGAGKNVYARLCDAFRDADDRYNSGLFHFKKGDGFPATLDTFTLGLKIDDKPLKEILGRLYFPDSPYEFSVLSPDILGQVYERFLGKVITTTTKRATIEEKPEVRRAGGVYYTPVYIVDHIVKSVLDPLLSGKTPNMVGGGGKTPPLRILDPACGSGSFLINAYQYLIDWHTSWYITDGAEKHSRGKRPKLHQTSAGEWRLTTAERRAILLNNIFGVDLDTQAVEVTKLSLLLKVLEGESEEAINAQLKMFHERALPDLGDNIKCGNSLIEGDFYDGKDMALFPEATQVRINAFDWNREFNGIDGFDAVIGNPPYIRIQEMKKRSPEEVVYFKERYSTGAEGSYDIYVLFVEKALGLLNEKGRMGYILPNKFFTAKYGRALRDMVAQGRHLSELVDFTDQQVFKDATTYTTLLFLSKSRSTKFHHTEVTNLAAWRQDVQAGRKQFPARTVSADLWVVVHDNDERALYERLKSLTAAKPLGSIIQSIGQGIRTSRNEVYVLRDVTEDPASATAEGYSVQLDKRVTVDLPLAKRFLDGKAAKAFSLTAPGQAVIVPYTVAGGRADLITECTMRKDYKKTFDYLTACKAALEERERGRLRGKPNWYGYIYPKNLEVMASPKLVVPDTANSAAVAIDDQGQYALTSGWGITLNGSTKESLWYVMALLNSPVLDFFWRKVTTRFQGGYYRYFHENLNPIPIYRINFAEPSEKATHDAIVSDAQALVQAYQAARTATTGAARTTATRTVQRLTGKLNKQVADLYDLTLQERTLIRM